MLALFSWKEKDVNGEQVALDICRLIIAGMYVYSGLNKLNPYFMSELFPWFIQPLIDSSAVVTHISIIVPLFEICIGILFLSKFKHIALAMAVAMHVIVLLSIGPWGHNWNMVVWPWNIAMIVLCLILFLDEKDTLSERVFALQRYSDAHKALLFVLLVMPVCTFFGLWDSYLSWSLYSGNTDKGVLVLSDSVKDRLPSVVKRYVRTEVTGQKTLEFTQWSADELRAALYPEERVFKSIAKSLCKFSSEEGDMTLYVSKKMTLTAQNKMKVFTCDSY